MGWKNVTYRRPALLVWLLVAVVAALPALHDAQPLSGYCVRSDDEQTSDSSYSEFGALPFSYPFAGTHSPDAHTCSGRNDPGPASSSNATLTEVRIQDTAKRPFLYATAFPDHPVACKYVCPSNMGPIATDTGPLNALRSIVLLI